MFLVIKFTMRELLLEIFNRLYKEFGKQHWWPAETKDEIVIGAVLTQNTAWSNVERAISNLKKAGVIRLKDIVCVDESLLKELIKPAGFFNQKALYLKGIASFIEGHGGLSSLSKQDTHKLRRMLLSVKGVGKETADSILLYAFERPVFVVDAYTKRLVSRHGLSEDLSYDGIQRLFMENLPLDVGLFNEYHALIVKLAKEHCKKKPLCSGCPLERL